MKSISECSVHGKAEGDETDEEKALGKLLGKLLRRMGRVRAEGEPDDDDLPLEHHESVRMAHKQMKTAKAYHAASLSHIGKAVDLLNDVVEALDSDPDKDDDADDEKPAEKSEADDEPNDDDTPEETKAKQLRRAKRLRERNRT